MKNNILLVALGLLVGAGLVVGYQYVVGMNKVEVAVVEDLSTTPSEIATLSVGEVSVGVKDAVQEVTPEVVESIDEVVTEVPQETNKVIEGNVFDPETIEVGDVVAGMTLVDIESRVGGDVGYIFEGKKVVQGTLDWGLVSATTVHLDGEEVRAIPFPVGLPEKYSRELSLTWPVSMSTDHETGKNFTTVNADTEKKGLCKDCQIGDSIKVTFDRFGYYSTPTSNHGRHFFRIEQIDQAFVK